MNNARHHVKRRWIFPLALAVVAFYAMGCATSPPTPLATESAASARPSTGAQELTEIRVVDEQGSLSVVLAGSDSLRYTAYKTIDPLRLVVDLPNARANAVPSPLPVEKGVINKIETATVSLNPHPLTRVEIGLNRETSYEINAEQDGIRVRFEPGPQPMEAKNTEVELARVAPSDNPGHGAQVDRPQ